MTISVKETQGNRCRVAAHGAMTIYEAPADRRALLVALSTADEMEVDLSEVSEMDTAGMQVLVLLKREARAAGKTVRLTAHSPATLEVIDRFNLASYFGDPVVISDAR